jgi:DNA-binding PadR family transcriptional regulator
MTSDTEAERVAELQAAGRNIYRLQASLEGATKALRQSESALEQLLDDMSDDGLCVCLAAKKQASAALDAVRTILKERS